MQRAAVAAGVVGAAGVGRRRPWPPARIVAAPAAAFGAA